MIWLLHLEAEFIYLLVIAIVQKYIEIVLKAQVALCDNWLFAV